MFKTVFCRDAHPRTMLVLTTHAKLADACEHRRRLGLSGDLVVDEHNVVSTSPDWLFDWEKTEPTCYARRMQGVNLTDKGYRSN